MNLCSSCSLTGGGGDQPVHAALVDHLLAAGVTAPTARLAHPNIMAEEAVAEPAAVYQRDIRWIDACDAVSVGRNTTQRQWLGHVLSPHPVGRRVPHGLRLGQRAAAMLSA